MAYWGRKFEERYDDHAGLFSIPKKQYIKSLYYAYEVRSLEDDEEQEGILGNNLHTGSCDCKMTWRKIRNKKWYSRWIVFVNEYCSREMILRYTRNNKWYLGWFAYKRVMNMEEDLWYWQIFQAMFLSSKDKPSSSLMDDNNGGPVSGIISSSPSSSSSGSSSSKSSSFLVTGLCQIQRP